MDMNSDLEFEKQIKEFNRAEQFLARQIKEMKENCPSCNPGKRQGFFNVSGLLGFVTAVILAVMEGMRRS
jgi:hypothetical protein